MRSAGEEKPPSDAMWLRRWAEVTVMTHAPVIVRSRIRAICGRRKGERMNSIAQHQIEVCVLGAMICSVECAKSLKERAQPEMFTEVEHRLILRALVGCLDEFCTVDAVLVNRRLDGAVEASYIASLITDVPNIEAWPQYFAELERSHGRREIGRLAQRLTGEESAEELSSIGSRIRELAYAGCVPQNGSRLDSSIKQFEEYKRVGVEMTWGVEAVDAAVGGVRGGILYTVGGKTNQGKTALAANLIAANPGKKVLYNGVENLDQVWPRVASIVCSVPLDIFTKPYHYSDSEVQQAREALLSMKGREEVVRILPGVSVGEMRKMCSVFHPNIIILDYIQRYAHRHRLGERGLMTHEIGRVVSDLQDLALEEKAACIILSQFSRLSEEVRGRKPLLEDLKESGEIENMSDVVLLLWHRWKEGTEGVNPEEYRVLVAKNKLGGNADVKCRIDLKTLKISGW